jgi:putative hemolysin
MAKQKIILSLMLLVLIAFLLACSSQPQKYMLSKEDIQKEREKENTGLANPATMFCMNQSGNSWLLKEDDSGSQYGLCRFSDGSWCEEWDYYRGDCVPGTNLTECRGRFWGKSICQADYNPVCARIKVNESNVLSESWETFSNACNACIASEENFVVVGYTIGRCK